MSESVVCCTKAVQKSRPARPQGGESSEAYLVLYVEGFERLRTQLRAFFSSHFVVHFDIKAEIFDHPPDFVGTGIRSRDLGVFI